MLAYFSHYKAHSKVLIIRKEKNIKPYNMDYLILDRFYFCLQILNQFWKQHNSVKMFDSVLLWIC